VCQTGETKQNPKKQNPKPKQKKGGHSIISSLKNFASTKRNEFGVCFQGAGEGDIVNLSLPGASVSFDSYLKSCVQQDKSSQVDTSADMTSFLTHKQL